MADTKEQTETKTDGPVRVWLDGCFDLWHYGHANAIRQAKLQGDVLVTGVHSDEEIRKCKGLPVMSDEERLSVVRSCKWVDEVVTDAPYVTSLDVLNKHNITFCVHGEDLSTDENGNDSFILCKQANKFKLIKRTDGVSTTDIVTRMLLMTKNHHKEGVSEADVANMRSSTNVKQFLTTSRKIIQFSSGKVPKPDDKIVYVDGVFDLFHMGHVNLLARAKAEGDFLIVGVHADRDVNLRKGANYPIMNLHERVLTVLACKYVDEVIIGAPYHITEDMIDSLNLSLVVHGDDPVDLLDGEEDPLRIAKERGLYKEVPHTPGISTETIITRIITRRLEYETSNAKKRAKNSKINPTPVPQEVLENF